MTRALCHFDNAYWLPDVLMHGYMGKTNTQSNTAFRGFGGPQGAIAIENILDGRAQPGLRSARRAPRQLLRQDRAQRHAYGRP
jgi:xanthine dehydrogenase molybdopterin-binding subunit B